MPTVTNRQSHISIDTADLARSGAFYRALLGAEPALERPDYLRFWPSELGLVLALNARAPATRGPGAGATGPLQHLGLLFPDQAGLQAARARLAAAGFASPGAEHTTCCYAELDQYWATDPSGVRWELFLAHEEVLPAPTDGASGCTSACCP